MKIVALSDKKVRSGYKFFSVFNNSDINRCPVTGFELYDMDGEVITQNMKKLVWISPDAYDRD